MKTLNAFLITSLLASTFAVAADKSVTDRAEKSRRLRSNQQSLLASGIISAAGGAYLYSHALSFDRLSFASIVVGVASASLGPKILQSIVNGDKESIAEGYENLLKQASTARATKSLPSDASFQAILSAYMCPECSSDEDQLERFLFLIEKVEEVSLIPMNITMKPAAEITAIVQRASGEALSQESIEQNKRLFHMLVHASLVSKQKLDPVYVKLLNGSHL